MREILKKIVEILFLVFVNLIITVALFKNIYYILELFQYFNKTNFGIFSSILISIIFSLDIMENIAKRKTLLYTFFKLIIKTIPVIFMLSIYYGMFQLKIDKYIIYICVSIPIVLDFFLDKKIHTIIMKIVKHDVVTSIGQEKLKYYFVNLLIIVYIFINNNIYTLGVVLFYYICITLYSKYGISKIKNTMWIILIRILYSLLLYLIGVYALNIIDISWLLFCILIVASYGIRYDFAIKKYI